MRRRLNQDQLRQVGHHEAGHAVAACLRGSLVESRVTLALPGRTGFTEYVAAVGDGGFISFAGPWSEARFGWGERPLDERDDCGFAFADYRLTAFLEGGHSDSKSVRAHHRGERDLRAGTPHV